MKSLERTETITICAIIKKVISYTLGTGVCGSGAGWDATEETLTARESELVLITTFSMLFEY